MGKENWEGQYRARERRGWGGKEDGVEQRTSVSERELSREEARREEE